MDNTGLYTQLNMYAECQQCIYGSRRSAMTRQKLSGGQSSVKCHLPFEKGRSHRARLHCIVRQNVCAAVNVSRCSKKKKKKE